MIVGDEENVVEGVVRIGACCGVATEGTVAAAVVATSGSGSHSLQTEDARLLIPCSCLAIGAASSPVAWQDEMIEQVKPSDSASSTVGGMLGASSSVMAAADETPYSVVAQSWKRSATSSAQAVRSVQLLLRYHPQQ